MTPTENPNPQGTDTNEREPPNVVYRYFVIRPGKRDLIIQANDDGRDPLDRLPFEVTESAIHVARRLLNGWGGLDYFHTEPGRAGFAVVVEGGALSVFAVPRDNPGARSRVALYGPGCWIEAMSDDVQLLAPDDLATADLD